MAFKVVRFDVQEFSGKPLKEKSFRQFNLRYHSTVMAWMSEFELFALKRADPIQYWNVVTYLGWPN